jgi:hypothetical protein
VSQFSAGAAVPDSQPAGVPGESVLCRSSSASQPAGVSGESVLYSTGVAVLGSQTEVSGGQEISPQN